MISAIFIFLLASAAIATFYFATKSTYLCLNFRNGQIWPIQIYREFFMVVSGALLALAYGVNSFEGAILNARDEDSLKIGLLAVYAVFGFGATLALLSRYFRIPTGKDQIRSVLGDYRVRRFANAAAASGLSLFAFASVFLSYKHAFITSILTGEGLVSVRLRNAYESHLPSQVAQVISISWWVISIYAGLLIYKKKRRGAVLYGVIALFLASAAGDKAPVMMCFVLMSLSYLSVRGFQLSVRAVFKALCLYAPFLYAVLYFVVSLQIPDLTIGKFNIYLLNRIGVGQMAGVFETFSISRLSGDFYWHMVPGASFFVDYIPYDKALMMVTEGYGYSEMGVKNSFFISEAYGIGGMLLVFFSPIIIGICYALGSYFLYLFLKRFFGHAVSVIFTLPIYILSSALTGGFSSFPLFKGLLLEVLCLGVIWMVFQFFRLSFRRAPNRRHA